MQRQKQIVKKVNEVVGTVIAIPGAIKFAQIRHKLTSFLALSTVLMKKSLKKPKRKVSYYQLVRFEVRSNPDHSRSKELLFNANFLKKNATKVSANFSSWQETPSFNFLKVSLPIKNHNKTSGELYEKCLNRKKSKKRLIRVIQGHWHENKKLLRGEVYPHQSPDLSDLYVFRENYDKNILTARIFLGTPIAILVIHGHGRQKIPLAQKWGRGKYVRTQIGKPYFTKHLLHLIKTFNHHT